MNISFDNQIFDNQLTSLSLLYTDNQFHTVHDPLLKQSVLNPQLIYTMYNGIY